MVGSPLRATRRRTPPGISVSRRTAAREPLATRGDRSALSRIVALAWVGFLTILVVGPWLRPGYIFGTDFAGPRFYRFPTAAASYAGLQFVLAVVALVVPGDVVG